MNRKPVIVIIREDHDACTICGNPVNAGDVSILYSQDQCAHYECVDYATKADCLNRLSHATRRILARSSPGWPVVLGETAVKNGDYWSKHLVENEVIRSPRDIDDFDFVINEISIPEFMLLSSSNGGKPTESASITVTVNGVTRKITISKLKSLYLIAIVENNKTQCYTYGINDNNLCTIIEDLTNREFSISIDPGRFDW